MKHCKICHKKLMNNNYKICFPCEILKNHKEIQKKKGKYKKKQRHEYYVKNRINILKRCKKYSKQHKQQINQYKRNRQKIDINFKLACYLRHRIWSALKRNVKSVSTIKLLGCSIEQLKKYLEKQFKPGMTWKNYGKWHIDHIRPCSSFNLSKASEQYKCFNYKNLQPLWAKDNLSKKKF